MDKISFRNTPCPFSPEVMVWVLSIEMFSMKNDDDLGVAMMECLTWEERMQVFSAGEWYRENYKTWDRKTYK